MLIIALVLAVIGLAALVTAVVTSNELVAWVCIGASALGVLLLIADAIRERQHRRVAGPVSAVAGAVTDIIEPVETTEVIEPVVIEPVVIEPVVIEPVEDLELVQDGGSTDGGSTDGLSDDTDTDTDDDTEDEDGYREANPEVGDYPEVLIEDHPDEVVYDDPEHDTPSDDEPDFPMPAEEVAVHTVGEDYLAGDPDAPDFRDSDDLSSDYLTEAGQGYVTEVSYPAEAYSDEVNPVETYTAETYTVETTGDEPNTLESDEPVDEPRQQ